MSRRLRWIAILVILLVVSAASAVIALSHIGSEEQPPCRACAQQQMALVQVSVCELSHSQQMLAGKSVRVSAEFVNDSGQLFLKDRDCVIEAGFAKESNACSGAWRKPQVASGVNTWYDGGGYVAVTGSISRIPGGNYYAGEEGFAIKCLEQTRTEPTFRKRIKFAVDRLASLWFSKGGSQGAPRA